VKSFLAGGHLLVAAPGNDGPAAPPNYPAAYPGVIGVTSIDEKGKLELDANPSHALFAARGVNVRAASLPRGYASLTGTSYATPVITARLARLLRGSDAAGSPTAAVNTLIKTVDRLDAGGTNPVYVVRDIASEATASHR
jgi:subtilisin family serine protease